MLARDGLGGFAGVFFGDVVVDEGLEGGGEFVVSAFERNVLFTVNVDRAARGFTGAGQADADVGGFGFAGAVDDAAHHGERHGFDAFVLRFPDGHAVANVTLNRFGQFLKRGAGGAAAAGAGGYAGREGTQAEGLEQFAGGVDFFATVATGAWRERNANGVANAFVEQHAERSG